MGIPSVSSAQTSPLRSTFTHWVLFPDLTPLSSPGRDPKLKSVHYRIPVSPPRSVSLHWNFPPRSRAPRSPTTSIRSPEPLLFYFPLNPPLIFSSTANFFNLTSNLSTSHALHHHSFDELLIIKCLLHSRAPASILHLGARVNVLKCYCIMHISLPWASVQNSSVSASFFIHTEKSSLGVWIPHCLRAFAHTFFCLECSSQSWFLLILKVQLKDSVLIVYPFSNTYSLLFSITISHFSFQKFTFYLLLFFFTVSLLDYEFNLGKTYIYFIHGWLPSTW